MFKIYTVYQRGVSLAPLMTENEHTADLYWRVIELEFKAYPRSIVAAYYYKDDSLKWFIED